MLWIACVAPLLAAPNPVATDAGPQSNLTGRWRLDEEQSEQPSEKLRPLEPGEKPGRLPEEPGQGQPDDTDWLRSRQEGRAPSKFEAPVGLEEFFDAPRTLIIGGSGDVLTFEDERENRLQLPLDGGQHARGPLSCTARWDGSSLVVEKTNEAGILLTTRYNLMPGQPRRLEVYSRLAGKDGRAVTLRRVYDGAEQQSRRADLGDEGREQSR